MVNNVKTRDYVIDLLRAIGIILIFAAHCSFPEWFHYFRSFDVVLLMFVSGLSFHKSEPEWNVRNYFQYLKKRVVRLIIPVWIYLAVFFVIFNFALNYGFDRMTIIKSFLFTAGGILFVWIYRIFIGTAVTTPLLSHFLKKVPDLWIITLSVLFLAGNDALHYYVIHPINKELLSDLLSYLFTYPIGYGLMVFLGSRFTDFTHRTKQLFTVVFGILFLSLALILRFAYLELFKHPPYLYYISYGLMWSGFLYLLFTRLQLPENKVIIWISKNSMKLYLAHIGVYYLMISYLPKGIIQFAVLFGLSCILVVLFNLVENALKGKKKDA